MATKADDKPKATAKETKEPIVYKFTPINPGDHLRDVPQRDLTAADVLNIGPVQLRDATVPGPSGKAMYTAVTPADEKEGDA
jgi:hypothetical protein